MKFGENLRKLRERNQLSQEQLAELVGVSRQSVSKWEREESFPSMERLLKLCQIFDCDLADLLTESGEEETGTSKHSQQEEKPNAGLQEATSGSDENPGRNFGWNSGGNSGGNSDWSGMEPESRASGNKAGHFVHTSTFRAACAAVVLTGVILLAVMIVRGAFSDSVGHPADDSTASSSEALSSLYHYKSDSGAEIIDAESAHVYYGIIQNRLREGRDDCVCNTIMYLAEDKEQDFLDTSTLSYALYTETYSHGNGFLVTLSVVTVYDGETERIGLVWVDVTPQALAEFEVDTSVLKGDDTAADETLIYICGYTVRIPLHEMDSALAQQYGYQKWQEDSYYKSEQIILISESVF